MSGMSGHPVYIEIYTSHCIIFSGTFIRESFGAENENENENHLTLTVQYECIIQVFLNILA